MPGINPKTGLYDFNYNPSSQGQSATPTNFGNPNAVTQAGRFNPVAPSINSLNFGLDGVNANQFGAVPQSFTNLQIPQDTFLSTSTNGFGNQQANINASNAVDPNQQFGFSADQLSTLAVDPTANVEAPAGTNVGGAGTDQSSLFGDLGTKDVLGLGLGLGQLGLSAYFGNQQIDVAEGNLALGQENLAFKQQQYDDRLNAAKSQGG